MRFLLGDSYSPSDDERTLFLLLLIMSMLSVMNQMDTLALFCLVLDEGNANVTCWWRYWILLVINVLD
jgi:hypothetical protein